MSRSLFVPNPCCGSGRGCSRQPIALIAAQHDGTILYDENQVLIGRSLNETTKGLANVAPGIIAAPSGIAVYRAPNSTVDRSASWEAVGLHGREWWLLVAQR